MHRSFDRAPWVLVAVAGLVACRASGAQDRTPMARSAWGVEVHWAREDVELEPVLPPEASGLSNSDLMGALDDEARAWNTALAGCRAPRIHIGSLRPYGTATDDGHGRVVVKVASWCPDGNGDPDDCYDPTRQAKTTLRLRRDVGPRDAEIREADLEINAVHFRWSPDGRTPGTRCLRALVAHELGHVLGLDHARSPASVMYADPTGAGRTTVLEPTADAIRTLCEPL